MSAGISQLLSIIVDFILKAIGSCKLSQGEEAKVLNEANRLQSGIRLEIDRIRKSEADAEAKENEIAGR